MSDLGPRPTHPSYSPDNRSQPMSEESDAPSVTPAPTSWLAAVAYLLNELAREGISVEGCEDPAELLVELAKHLGVGDADDPWFAAVQKLARCG